MTAKKSGIIIALAAALLTACGVPDTPEPDPTPTQPAATAPPDPAGTEAMRRLYEEGLNDLYYIILSEGTGAEENFYAVYDVDGDGLNELIIEYNSTTEAGKLEGIYGYDPETGLGTEELLQYPALTYYDNGIIRADFSHNQGLAGRFWPYFLYKYDPSKDIYECVAMADAWDGSIHSVDYEGRPFPAEIDKSGEGIVYYLLGPDDTTLGEPVDKSEYESWLAGYIGDAQELTLPKIPLERGSFSEGSAGTYELWLAQSGERGYYSDVTGLSKGEVERFALEVRRSILEHDWESLAGYSEFPLPINSGEAYRDARDLIADAPERLTGADFTEALISETCEELPFDSEGIKMAGGRIRLAEISTSGAAGELRVTWINTHT